MTVRRRFLLCVSFVTAVLLLSATARAQQPPRSPGQHEPLVGSLTPEQVKQALERLGGGAGSLPPEFRDALRKKLIEDFQQKKEPVDPKQIEGLMRALESNPKFMQMLMDEAKKQSGGGGSGKQSPPPDFKNIFKNLAPLQQPGMPPMGGPTLPMPKGTEVPMPGGKEPPDPPVPDPKVEGPRPAPMPEAQPFPKLEPNQNNPFDPNETPREKGMRAAAAMWERNIGPLEETPAVKRALFDLVEGTDDITDGEGNSFWDTIGKETGDATSFADFIEGAALGDSWTMPKFDLPSLGWGSSNPNIGGGGGSNESWWSRFTSGRSTSTSTPRAPSTGSSGFNIGIPGMEGTWLPVVLLAVILFGALIAWRFWYLKDARSATAFDLGGLGPWPIDPRRITTREHVVVAFQYLSVLICGPAAKTWTHGTIAEALADLAATHGEPAILLARLYELARYAPLDEPMTTTELAEARRLVCRLAGLEHE